MQVYSGPLPVAPAAADEIRALATDVLAPAGRPRGAGRSRAERILASYTDAEGVRHELLTWRGAACSTLVVDRESRQATPRLVAHLAADEPAENARVVCEDYLQRAQQGLCRFRAMSSRTSALRRN